MKVDVLRATEQPERLVCQAARGDYYGGYVGDTQYAELMKHVSYQHGGKGIEDLPYDNPAVVDAKTRSFIRQQLSRGHFGPWEHPQITFAVKGVSRVLMAQITRHRHMTFDVQSMRYANFEDSGVVTPRSLTDDEHKTRNEGMVWYDMESDVPLDEQEPDSETRENALRLYEKAVENSMKAYKSLVDAGVPKEDARFALPLGTSVNMTFSGNAHTFMHIMNVRKKPDAQWEVQELSEKLFEELRDWMPYTFEWYDERNHKLAP